MYSIPFWDLTLLCLWLPFTNQYACGMPRHYMWPHRLVWDNRSLACRPKYSKSNCFIFFLLYQTRVQASTLSFPELISKLPQIGLRGLYRGSIPAILGQFSRSVLFNWFICKILCRLQNSNPVICSHGLRTGIFEASKLVLINVAPTLPEIQVWFTTPVLLVQTLLEPTL